MKILVEQNSWSVYHNKYLRALGILIIIYGLGDKFLSDGNWSTVIIGSLVAIIGGYFPYALVGISWVIGGIYLFTAGFSQGDGWSLGAIPSGSWILFGLIIVITLIVAGTSKYVGEHHQNVYIEKKDNYH